MIIVTGDRPSVFDLWVNYRFQPRMLSRLADVDEQIIHNMLMHLPIERSDAQKVLDKLSTLIHKKCTLETMYVPIRAEKGNDDANARETAEPAESE
jgi:hypothetical protein